FYSSLNAQWIQSGLDGYFVRTINVSGTNLFVGTSGDGISRSTNSGTSWTPINTGLTNLFVNAFTVSGTDIFAGTEGDGVFRSTNNGASWSATAALLNPYVYALAVLGSNIFAGADGDGVFRSSNNGASWTLVSAGLTNTRIFALTASGTNLYAGTFGGGVFLSTNNGTSWSPISAGLTNTSINTIVVSGTNLFAGTENGIFLSPNNGTSWTEASTGLTNTFIHAIAFSGTNLFAGSEDGVFFSTNNGTSWNTASTGLTNTLIWALAVSETNLFAGSNGNGVWRRPIDSVVPVELVSFTSSTNGNDVVLNWSTATETNNSGFEIERSVISIPILPDGRQVYRERNLNWGKVGFVNGNGTTTETQSYSFNDNNLLSGKYLYRLKQIDFDGTFEYSNEVEVIINVPDKFELSQNYPNPFNPTTKIKYQIATSDQVSLKIYDVLGNEVASLVNELQPSGIYEVTFDARSLSSGTYFYKLQAGSFVEIKKMILLK
ncbi:MAG: T9SS type A sorting domain-containing protein, partial [Ignavibacteria bacterium]|nr:T9SS type A sorting domain-containing protein [Ignavibacteria bacterium]